MTAMTCPRCARATADGLLCNGCLAHGRDELAKIAEHYNDVFTRRTGGGTSHGYAPKVPITDQQTKVASYVRNQLSTWVRELDMGDAASLPDEPVAWAQWISSRMQRIRTHAAGSEAIDEFDYCAGLIIGAINPRRTRTGCGACPVCGTDIFAIDDDPIGVCERCEKAGIVSTLPRLGQRQDLWRRIPDEPLPRKVLIEALEYRGVKIGRGRFRNWVHTGRLQPVDVVNGSPRYRVSDVLDLLQRTAA